MKRKIKCDVEDCVFHGHDCECTADCISVNYAVPSDSCQAKCATFRSAD
ncbi:MAG: DUF1540 domain-containing protein [Clostridia bacterium]|nr:DUF1540 domain-containing protein [Clostridia bacterium]